MNLMDRAIAAIAPDLGLRRMRTRKAIEVLAHYEAATPGNRGRSWRASGADADTAARSRSRLAFIARDMVRNTPFAMRAQMVIANNVVGDGIIPKFRTADERLKADLMLAVEDHLDSIAIDADGRQNLYGLQRLAMNTVVDAGEVLIRRRRRERTDGLPLPFQIQVMEPDFLDTTRDGTLPGGNTIKEGIEFDLIGRRVAYWLFSEHPGSAWRVGANWTSRRVPASEVLHIYRQDRPGQRRGVTWFAPVALALQDMADHQDAQLMRQKIAACFAAFRTMPDSDVIGDEAAIEAMSTLTPGRIQMLQPGEDITFAVPPGVEGYDEFTRAVLRSVAAGMGITFEALTGDMSQVNFSSARMGRMEMDRNVSSWQWLLMVPQMLQPMSAWFLEAFQLQRGRRLAADLRLDWVPPHRMLVDPAREIVAMREEVRAGFASRQGIIRKLGHDPELVLAEQIEDAGQADAAGLTFSSDARDGVVPETFDVQGGDNG